jgi:hypothetical protein
MEVRLNNVERQVPSSPCVDQNMLKTHEERANNTKTTAQYSRSDDKRAQLVSLPTEQEEMRNSDDLKVLTDNNENSLSVDTLIEILSSNDTTNKSLKKTTTTTMLPASEESDLAGLSQSSDLLNASNLSSPSSSKTGVSETIVSPGPSPKSSGYVSPKKFPSPYHLNGGKPMISDMNKKMKQVAKRQPRATYQSKISDTAIGIKLCIKKSVKSQKSVPSTNSKSPRKRSRKPKAKGLESDSDESYVKRRKKQSTINNNNSNSNNNNINTKAPLEEPVEQSGWGKAMPKEILFDVSTTASHNHFFLPLQFSTPFFRFSRWS